MGSGWLWEQLSALDMSCANLLFITFLGPVSHMSITSTLSGCYLAQVNDTTLSYRPQGVRKIHQTIPCEYSSI